MNKSFLYCKNKEKVVYSLQKFSKLHSFMKYCPNCDEFTRISMSEEMLACESCNSEWHVEKVIEDYEQVID